jgi:hypothetical protein
MERKHFTAQEAMDMTPEEWTRHQVGEAMWLYGQNEKPRFNALKRKSALAHLREAITIIRNLPNLSSEPES